MIIDFAKVARCSFGVNRLLAVFEEKVPMVSLQRL